MAKSEDSKMEAETIIRWDETDAHAILWTLSPKVRQVWDSYLFPVQPSGRGWTARVPSHRITYKTFAKSLDKQAQK
jgi:hypothetical protein